MTMYKIGEFAAMVGLSQSKIRFYEKYGLFDVTRSESGYRYYTPEDAFRVNAFRVLQQYGFTIEQAVKFLDEKQGGDEYRQTLLAQRELLRQQQDLLKYRLERINYVLDDVLNHQPSQNFEVVDYQDYLYILASVGRDFSISQTNEQEIALFYDLLSLTSCARIISKADFENSNDFVNPNYMICMPIQEEYRLGDYDKTKIKRLNLGKCVRFHRLKTREESVKKESFSDLVDYLDSHGYKIRGDILLFPTFLNLDGNGKDYEVLVVPIC